MQSTAEIDAARGRPQAHQGPSKVPRHSGPSRDDGSPGWQVSGGGGRGRGRGRGAQLALMPALATAPIPPLLALMPVPAAVNKGTATYILQRNRDLKARISDTFPTDYKESRHIPLSPRIICMMRQDYYCPRCHEPRHMDVDSNNKQLCYKRIASDWPSGHYVGSLQAGITMPSKNARMAADFMGVL